MCCYLYIVHMHLYLRHPQGLRFTHTDSYADKCFVPAERSVKINGMYADRFNVLGSGHN
jgi:hypothetical protein